MNADLNVMRIIIVLLMSG